MRLERRAFMGGASALALLALVPMPVAAALREASGDVAVAIDAILDGRTPLEEGVTLDAPLVAQNGAQVPLTIAVDSPMSADDHVTTLHVVATRNPTPGIGRFHLTPALGRAEVAMRIRLAEAQQLIVLAELSDGRVLAAAAQISVTEGGCAT